MPKGFHAFVPLLKGLHVQGNTLKAVKASLREAVVCHLQAMAKANEKIPVEAEAFELIETFSREEIHAVA